MAKSLRLRVGSKVVPQNSVKLARAKLLHFMQQAMLREILRKRNIATLNLAHK